MIANRIYFTQVQCNPDWALMITQVLVLHPHIHNRFAVQTAWATPFKVTWEFDANLYGLAEYSQPLVIIS